MVSAPSNGANGHANGHANGTNGSHAIPIVDPTAARRPTDLITVESPSVKYDATHIKASYVRHGSSVEQANGRYTVRPTELKYEFKTERKVAKTGLMLVGWGGNNGSTLTASLLATKHNITWHTRDGVQTPNFYGSLVRASTVRLGEDSKTGKDVFVPLADVLPTVHPCDLVIGGWDISGLSLDAAMARAKVVDYDLQRQVAPLMADLIPLPSIYYPDFIAANQEDRADNLIAGDNKQAHLEHIRKDIRDFKAKNGLDKVIVLWTANTERYAELGAWNDTAEHLLESIANSHDEVSPSTLFAVASVLENAPFINGAPQNTCVLSNCASADVPSFVPGLIQLAEKEKAFIGGDDFKSGQTKFKSAVACGVYIMPLSYAHREFLVGAGIKPLSISSYNHLGNNDGRNLQSQAQFRSKEISKSSVVDDMVASNSLLYKPVLETPGGEAKVAKGEKERKTEHPDHLVVIKYVPSVGDDKRAIDEYYSELMMGGRSTISTFNICADSFLAVPLILDLCILTELMTRVEYKEENGEFGKLYSVLSLLSYMTKAPLVRPGTDVINGLSRQRHAVEHFLRALIGLQPLSELEPAKLMGTVRV